MARKKKGKKKGGKHGPSIKNPAVYESLITAGKTKTVAAKISNAALKKGHKKGKHRR